MPSRVGDGEDQLALGLGRAAAGHDEQQRRHTDKHGEQRPGPALTGCTLLHLGVSRRSSSARRIVTAHRSRLHEVPVEEAFEAAVEVELGAGAEEAVGLGRVGDVLEGLAEPAQLRDELLGLARADALVALAVARSGSGTPTLASRCTGEPAR